ncbi:MAG: adenine deaminase C-terminal domain-containing protein, partial [Thermoplasmatota archaeon]
GLLQEGDKADFIVVDDIKNLEIKDVYINGKKVYDGNEPKFSRAEPEIINNFVAKKKAINDFRIKPQDKEINVISIDGKELITKRETTAPKIKDGNVVSDIDRDILKLSMINRYSDQEPSIGFAKGFGIKEGALATSISHDSHNVIGVGTTDGYLCKAVNKIIENKGGMCVITDEEEKCLPLPIAGLMSDKNHTKVSEDYKSIKELSKRTGSELRSPFMTLSFLSLLVIPEIKISDKGLFDVNKFEFIDLFE